MSLNTQELQRLCEAVVRDANGYNNGKIPKAQDESWAQLCEDSLPALEKFIKGEDEIKLSDLCDESLVLMDRMFAEQYRAGFDYVCEQADVNCVNKEEALATILRPIPPNELRAMMVHREKLEQEKQTNG